MADETKKTEEVQEGAPGFFQNKIVFAVVVIAVVVLAVVLITKFLFNIDLLNPSSGEMIIRRVFRAR